MNRDPSSEEPVISDGALVGSTYAQLVNVSVSDIDVTVEFSYVNPRDLKTGHVVSRVTMPRSVGLRLAELILTTNKMHEKRKRGGKDD